MLRRKFFTPEEVEAIVRDYRHAGLSAADAAMLSFAEKITLHAYEVTQADVDELRSHGFADAEILDIVLVAAARNFYSRLRPIALSKRGWPGHPPDQMSAGHVQSWKRTCANAAIRRSTRRIRA